jgi:hypothetical protein
MKKANNREMNDDLRPEYDLSKLKGGVRGKYAKRFQQGTNLVLLSPDIAKYFPDERSVNDALRSLVCIAKAKMRHAS